MMPEEDHVIPHNNEVTPPIGYRIPNSNPLMAHVGHVMPDKDHVIPEDHEMPDKGPHMGRVMSNEDNATADEDHVMPNNDWVLDNSRPLQNNDHMKHSTDRTMPHMDHVIPPIGHMMPQVSQFSIILQYTVVDIGASEVVR